MNDLISTITSMTKKKLAIHLYCDENERLIFLAKWHEGKDIRYRERKITPPYNNTIIEQEQQMFCNHVKRDIMMHEIKNKSESDNNQSGCNNTFREHINERIN